jgi:hypothetical protein
VIKRSALVGIKAMFYNQVISFIFFLLVLASLALVVFESIFIISGLELSSLHLGFLKKKKNKNKGVILVWCYLKIY